MPNYNKSNQNIVQDSFSHSKRLVRPLSNSKIRLLWSVLLIIRTFLWQQMLVNSCNLDSTADDQLLKERVVHLASSALSLSFPIVKVSSHLLACRFCVTRKPFSSGVTAAVAGIDILAPSGQHQSMTAVGPQPIAPLPPVESTLSLRLPLFGPFHNTCECATSLCPFPLQLKQMMTGRDDWTA